MVLCLQLLATDSGCLVYIFLARSALRNVTEVPHPLADGPVALLAIQRNSVLVSKSPFGQASLTRPVLLLQLRFYSRLISLTGVRCIPHRLAVYFLVFWCYLFSPRKNTPQKPSELPQKRPHSSATSSESCNINLNVMLKLTWMLLRGITFGVIGLVSAVGNCSHLRMLRLELDTLGTQLQGTKTSLERNTQKTSLL